MARVHGHGEAQATSGSASEQREEEMNPRPNRMGFKQHGPALPAERTKAQDSGRCRGLAEWAM